MSEYTTVKKRRNFANSAVHVLLNFALGVTSVFATIASKNPAIGLILVLTSKWRVFAVHPYYLWANIKSNLVDFIVGSSVVLLVYFSGAELAPINLLLTAFYCFWLIFLKPLSSEVAIFCQSLSAVFLGTSVVVLSLSEYDAITMIIPAYIIGRSASNHLFSHHNSKYQFLSVVCGLVFAEIMLISSYWSIVYPIFDDITGIRIPQVAIIFSVLLFIVYKAFSSAQKNDDKVVLSDILAPVIFSGVIILTMLIWFSNPIFNI